MASAWRAAGSNRLMTPRDVDGRASPANPNPATPTSTAATTAAAGPGPTRPDRVRTTSSGSSGEVDVDVLGLRVELERRHPELSTDARHLVTAERRLDVDRAVRVDADHARLHALRGPER